MARFICIVLLAVTLTACKNIFESMADTDTAESQIFKMKRHIDSFEWNEAIATYLALAPDTQSQRQPLRLYASALMGRCGFEFVSFVNTIVDGLDSGTERLFPLLLRTMPDSTSGRLLDCVSANTAIQQIVTTLGATTSEYNMSVLNGLAVMGAAVNNAAADASNLPTPGFNPCSPAAISDDDVRQVVAGFARVINDIPISSLSFLGNSLDGLCASGQPLQVAGVCDATDASAVTSQQVCAMRALLNENDSVGLGTNCSGDISTCSCVGCF